MQALIDLLKKENHFVIGLMSGTCTDGIDAALVYIEGHGIHTKVELIEFLTIPYLSQLRKMLLKIASGNYGGSYEISKANFLLGELLANACIEVCKKANIERSKIDFIGSHGHTIYHQPIAENYFEYAITSTLQIGEAAVIAENMKCPVFADFRVRDMAAGGLGAPLVPYTEYLLYGKVGKNIAFQNIGGIGNITFIPKNGSISNMLAFDTGPGNMIIDSLAAYFTNNKKSYDESGYMAAKGKVSKRLLNWMLQDDYIMEKPPKTTGRERYGIQFVKKLIEKSKSYFVKMEDVMATATMFTAVSIEKSISAYLPTMPEQLIVGGGGSKNLTLMQYLKALLPQCEVLTNENIGQNSDAKEAIAFAILANEALHGIENNVLNATKAKHGVIMGKLSL